LKKGGKYFEIRPKTRKYQVFSFLRKPEAFLLTKNFENILLLAVKAAKLTEKIFEILRLLSNCSYAPKFTIKRISPTIPNHLHPSPTIPNYSQLSPIIPNSFHLFPDISPPFSRGARGDLLIFPLFKTNPKNK